MDEKKIEEIKASDPYFEDIRSKTTIQFDFVLWIFRVLKSWYLFVFTVPFFLGIAYLDNLSWIPVYGVRAIIMLEAKGTGLINAVPLGNILRNAKNQAIVLESYEMAKRTVDALPQKLYVDYFRTGHFKTVNLYSNRPVKIDTIYSLQDDAYRYEFQIAPLDKDNCRIYIKGDPKQGKPSFSITVPYNKIIEDKSKFKIKLTKTNYFEDNFEPYSFRFLSKDQLIGMFNGQISANSAAQSSDMNVAMVGPVPERDVDYLSVLLDEFQEYNLSLKNEQANKTLTFIDKQLVVIKDSLQYSKDALDDFQNQTGVYEISSKSLRGELKEENIKRDQLAQFEKTLLLVTDNITQEVMSGKELVLPLWLLDPTDVVMAKIISGLQPLIDNYNNILNNNKNMGIKNPLYEQKVRDVNNSRAKIIDFLKLQQATLQVRKDDMIEQYETLYLKLANLPLQEKDLLEYQRVYQLNENFEQYLMIKRREVLLQRASNIPDNSIWEPARQIGGVINDGVKRERYMSYFMIAMILPLIFIVLKEEVFNNKINNKEECEKLSGLSVIGTIENIASKIKRGNGGLVKNYPKSSFAESFRNIRVRMEYLAQRENNITTLITSAEPADGKTFIATNIASVYQLTGKKVIIIDLDLRRPSVAKSLQLEISKGVSNYLIGQVTLDEIITSIPDLGFDVIAAGTLPPNPSELIKTEKTKELLDILKKRYDYVIIDCSPVGLVSDAYILSKYADITLFVVRRAKTNRSFFKSVSRQLRLDGVSNLALILNDVKGREGYYGTSRYYGNSDYYIKRSSYYHNDYYEN